MNDISSQFKGDLNGIQANSPIDPVTDLKSIHYFQKILEYSLDMICTTDAQGHFVSMSHAVENVLGYTVSEITGMEFMTFVHPDDALKTMNVASQILEGKPITNFTNRYRKKDGDYVYISWCSIWSEENQLMYGVARDVTETIQREQQNLKNEREIAEKEYYLREVGKVARVGGWELDLETKVSIWSHAVYDIYELPYSYTPHAAESIDYFAEPFKTLLEKSIDEALKLGKSWDIELELKTAKGRMIWVRSYGEVIYENNLPAKLRGIFMDIDKYHRNEAALNRSLDLLTQHNQQLKGFTHMLSHNLRNHANNISMLTQFIDVDKLDSGNKELVGKLEKVSQNLSNTLNDMSDAIKIRERVIKPDQIYLPDTIHDTLILLDADLKFNDAQISTNLLISELRFPKIYFESILSNLISNSLKYKKIAVKPEIIISTYLDEETKCIAMEYQDNGIGIDLKKNGNKVFGLYKTFSAHPDAHGVGLFLVKTQIESQGGQVMITSTPNIGTCFKILFKDGY